MNFKTSEINLPAEGIPKSRVVIIYTGGTFGMDYNKEGVLVPFDFKQILSQLPVIKKLSLEIKVVSFDHPIDSADIVPDHWLKLGEIIYQFYHEADGFVILHGTDTMAYTASALSFILSGLNKPVIFTGAQLPLSEPRSDARENLITTLEIAAARSEQGLPVVPEVCIYFDYELLRGNRSRKVESMEFDAFDSGNYPPLAKAGVTINFNKDAIRKTTGHPITINNRIDTGVAIIKVFPGITESLISSILTAPHVKAVVLETYGSGNIPGFDWLFDLLEHAIARGIIVVNVSQCLRGKVIQGKYQSSKRLSEIGVISGSDITIEAAVTKLMVLLGMHEIGEVRRIFEVPMEGEMSA